MFATDALIDRTILITGASSGLGRATAVLLSRMGARIIAVGRNEDRLIATASQLSGAGHVVRPFDLAAVEAIPEWLQSLAAECGPLRGVVHSAGVHLARPLQMLKADAVQQLLTVNVTAALMLAKGLRQRAVHESPASLVLMSSVMGQVGQAGVTAYSASKGAVDALCRSLALELATQGIRVNAIAPGQVETEMAEQQRGSLTTEQFERIRSMHPLGLGRAEDVASAVAFLISDASRWMTGTTLTVDGGYTAH
ncbi:MAG: SDR family oxidoreductase [Planctomycetaceae bacterium]|nr:SDR family oxidoreductase [Planctomycetaceae bacterium]